jgi:superfamily I DNA and/or RNA helicase
MPLVFENVIVDEAARANPLDLFIPMSLARRRVILVGDHRQLPHLLDPDIEEAVAGSVREQEQHVLKQSLFEKLFTSLPQLQIDQPVARVVTLRDQFRMHPTLGQFISDTFYAPHGEQFRSPKPASEFGHALPGYQKAGRPVFAAWKHLGQERGAEVSGRSKRRPCEAAWIAAEVKRLLNQGDSHLSLGVITFYLAQKNEILASLVNEGVAERDMDTGEIGIKQEYRTVQADDGRLTERLRVGTVDSFQGKEFDVVFLSVTRSNELPAGTEEERRRKYGHLLLENRLCVAMSRQRRMLVAVGDREMFSTTDAREAVPGLARFLDLCGGDDAVVL